MRRIILASVLLAALPWVTPAVGRSGFQGNHLYTTDEAERRYAMSLGFRDESDLDKMYVFTQSVPSSIQLFRLFNTRAGDHFYTTNPNERENALRNGWVDESAEHPLFVFPDRVPSECRENAQLNRLWSPQDTNHFYTTNQAEFFRARDQLGYQDENFQEIKNGVAGSGGPTVLKAPCVYGGTTAVRFFRLYHPGGSGSGGNTAGGGASAPSACPFPAEYPFCVQYTLPSAYRTTSQFGCSPSDAANKLRTDLADRKIQATFVPGQCEASVPR